MQKLLSTAIATLSFFVGAGSAIAAPGRTCPNSQEILMVSVTENTMLCTNPQGTIDPVDDIATLYMYATGGEKPQISASMMYAGSPTEYAFLIFDATSGELETLAFSASIEGDEIQWGDFDGNAQLFIDRDAMIAALIDLESYHNFR